VTDKKLKKEWDKWFWSWCAERKFTPDNAAEWMLDAFLAGAALFPKRKKK
jgi:hypothetical protein